MLKITKTKHCTLKNEKQSPGNPIYSKRSALANDFRREDTINKLHAGSNVKSQYAHSLIIFTQHRKGHVRGVSIYG